MDPRHSAAARVFALPELLEVIFLYVVPPSSPIGPAGIVYLDEGREPGPSGSPKPFPEYGKRILKTKAEGMRFLLCSAQRVNRTWNAVIASSSAIQEALFLKWVRGKDDAPVFNPLLVSTFIWGYFKPVGFPADREGFPKVISYAKASWRQMFPVLPPIQELNAYKQTVAGGYWCENCNGMLPAEKLQADGGLRMGLLFDIVEDWHDAGTAEMFTVTWWGPVDFERVRKLPGNR